MGKIIPLDPHFLNRPGVIAVYLVPYSDGVVLVDCGPASTLEALQAGPHAHGLTPADITHVLLTHIHLDHAGAAGWFAIHGAQVFVHPAGAPHLLNPEKLIASARRIYGQDMDRLWGKIWPLSPASLTEVQDGMEIAAGEHRFLALHTPGHAEHHAAYIFEDACFSGDIGGVRLPGVLYLRLPFVPPETDLRKWRDSLNRLRQTGSTRIALTHFGLYADADAHLTLAGRLLDEVESWLEATMPADPPVEVLSEKFSTWLHEQGLAHGLRPEVLAAYESSSPAQIDAQGLYRYWYKVRMAG